MDRQRLVWIVIVLAVIIGSAAVTYAMVVGNPTGMEPGPRSVAHGGLDCNRCHEAYSGTSDDLCLDCHADTIDMVWHSEARGDEDCAKCHYEHVGRDYITDLTQVPDHPSRDIELTGLHGAIRCSECHYTEVTEGECANCHERFIGGTHQVGFTTECQLCHLQSRWEVVYDHDGEERECLECHGEDPDHTYPGYLEYTDDCGVCHEVDMWLVPEFDHEGVNASCDMCHPTSLDPLWGGTSSDCSHCHMNTSWTPQQVDHFQIEPPCLRCHSEDVPPEHLSDLQLAPLECDSCHVPGESWNRKVQHIRHPQPCTQCHGTAAEVHEGPYAEDCQWCHRTDQRNILKPHPDQTWDCTLCHATEHEDGDPVRSVDAAHARECASCHIAGTDWPLLDIDHDALGQNCYSCHNATHGQIGGHLVACDMCHNTSYWVPTRVDHDALSNDCQACHVTIHPNGKERFSDQCTLCHATDDWAVRDWDHHLSNASDIDCVQCHDDIHRGSLGIVCEDCHVTDTWETDVINP